MKAPYSLVNGKYENSSYFLFITYLEIIGTTRFFSILSFWWIWFRLAPEPETLFLAMCVSVFSQFSPQQIDVDLLTTATPHTKFYGKIGRNLGQFYSMIISVFPSFLNKYLSLNSIMFFSIHLFQNSSHSLDTWFLILMTSPI